MAIALIEEGRHEVSPHGHARTYQVSRRLGINSRRALALLKRLERDGRIEKCPRYSGINCYAWRLKEAQG